MSKTNLKPVDDNHNEVLRKAAQISPTGHKYDIRHTDDPSARALRQLINITDPNMANQDYDTLGLVVNTRGVAITLNDGTLIYNS